MKITLGYARKVLASSVGEGYSPEDDVVVNQINKAIEWLLPKIKDGSVICRYKFTITNNIITLPRECESLLKVIIENNFSEINPIWYEFLGYGGGGLDWGGGYCYDVSYLGKGFVSFAEPPAPSKLLVVSEQEESGKRMTIQGRDEFGREISEILEIRKSVPFYTQNSFAKLENIIKDETDSYVLLSTFSAEPTERIDLGYYAPTETNPSYTRYYVKTNNPPKSALGLVRLKFLPVKRDTEPLLIQNIPALTLMLRALYYYDVGEISKAIAYEQKAQMLLEEQISTETPNKAVVEFGSINWVSDSYLI